MQRHLFRVLLLVFILVFVWGCKTGTQQTQSSPSVTAQTASSTQTQPKTAAAPASAAVAQKSGPIFDHKAPRDSVDWASLNPSGNLPEVKETDLEWPGERLGLIGPIVATGGSGAKQFIIVFDPAGIPVGALTRKAYKKDPGQLADLLAKAQVRSELQNLATLVYVMDRQKTQRMSASARP